MEEPLEIARGVALPLDEVLLRASRSSGPGGQHANVTASRVEAVFDVAASRVLSDAQKARVIERVGPRVTAVAQDARSQARNRELALERLRARLAAALATPKPRRPTRPTKASRRRHASAKQHQATRKQQRRPPGADE
ncbi:MAG TPA: alternative ribosome rescue aminoacyl-tRNA hydrolase ArfB [Conexibacter sp.]|jgi:ribosome-associated protein|nr:alternative ribosome rescue aminoacyl-tRNA hydrolase ArfB [Conexibacter sp.]